MRTRRRALFLDRDGVVNVDVGYLHTRTECTFMPGIFELVRRARELDYMVIVVTNQAGIARGYYSEQTFIDFMAWMGAEFEARSAPLTQVYHCPHHPDAGETLYRMTCACRKPSPGMLLRAAKEWEIDLAASIMVGDSPTDIEAAQAAGVSRRVLLGPVTAEHAHLDCLRASTLDQVAHWL